MSGMVTRATGASRSRKASSATNAAISAPKPPVRKSSCTMRQRRVRRTLSSTMSLSHGCSVLRSITSALDPSPAALQPDRILGVGGHRHPPARIVHELDLVGHRVPWVPALEETAGYAKHHRRREAVVGTPPHCAAIVDLLGRGLGIFAELDFG